jgi:hypothetical protein
MAHPRRDIAGRSGRRSHPGEQNGDIHASAASGNQRAAAKWHYRTGLPAICCGITTELENLAIPCNSIAQFGAVSG